MSEIMYTNPIGLSGQFEHCGNPFRVDTYSGCDFGCKYCFSNNSQVVNSKSQCANIKIIEKYFHKAFEENEVPTNVIVEMLRHRVPLHLGGLSDPFQQRERERGITYELIKLTNKYNYPMLISTKCAHLEDKYFEILNPKIHAFQISLISMDNDFISRVETNTPTPQQRVSFMKELKSRGFWVSCRIQPASVLEHSMSVVNACSHIVDYITIEHIKITTTLNRDAKNYLFNAFGIKPQDCMTFGMLYTPKSEIKKHNVNELKKISKCPIGCGDNDLHELSDSDNCCGVDTINENFDGWLKYNTLYINKTNDKSQWFPKCNCNNSFNSSHHKSGFNYKDYVDNRLSNPPRIKSCKYKL